MAKFSDRRVVPSPLKFYKYQSISNYSLCGLAEGEFYYSSVDKFNDPFELRLHPDACSDSFAENFRENEGLSTSLSTQECRDIFRDMWNELKGNIGVVCLSRKNDSRLMWGHYADKHKGMCLEFEIVSSAVYYPVEYSDIPPMVMSGRQGFWPPVAFSELLTVKHTDWRYESEVRLFSLEGNISRPYPKRCKLTAVTFGAFTSEKDMLKVRSILIEKNVKFRRAKLEDCSYSIEFHDEM